ncbi:site-specific integrase [Terasakiella sp. A23]|uniref:site-specific integrase n=1 Tax=Terasakiella sp. FCG-A23 TaxID=3080561 RepID=UPI0029558ECE|nr:site-specific integrase [Terasakiella sp. A23]MDV7339301.1 site-specific integrase [Terasakiella sp. A23]
MASIRSRNGKLFLDFRYRKQRCREATSLDDTPQNRRRLNSVIKRMEAEITLGTFIYGKYFPKSSKLEQFSTQEKFNRVTRGDIPMFEDFVDLWFSEKKVEWRTSHINNVRLSLDVHILPYFSKRPVNHITKADILNFRSKLAKRPGKTNKFLSPSRINHIMTPLRMIITEAADRYEFTSPWQNIKQLRVPKTEVHPFTLEEVHLIINSVRRDFRNYYTVRFFTGMRTAEIDGLQWKYVDFARKQILVHEAYVKGEMVQTKTDGSHRAIHMSQPVFDALKSQENLSRGTSSYVFCGPSGKPLNHNNVSRRIWHPLLRHLNLERRRPYQTRHTAATLWLASGENPEWIARQMGHSSTEMLFTVYSRYVPNLTRQDGSAFERLLTTHFTDENKGTKHE